jgi:hypothetical protein
MSQKRPNPAGRPHGGGKKDFKQGNYKKGKGKGKPRMENPPTWMAVPPKNGESITRLWKARTIIGTLITTDGPGTGTLSVKGLVSRLLSGRIKATIFANSNKPNVKLSKALAAISDEDDE